MMSANQVELARIALDDAASRGFPNNDRANLESQWRAALSAQAQRFVDSVNPAGPGDMAIYNAIADNYRAEAAPQPAIETKTYSDGSSATGVAPLPDQSPAQQELSDGAKRVMDSFDDAPYADFGNH